MNFIKHPIVLEGEKIKLLPLEDTHFDRLLAMGKPAEIWDNLPVNGSDEDLLRIELKSAILKRMSGEQYPFVIMEKSTGNIIGSTRFLNILSEHKKLEIGWTWYNPIYWGTGYNTESKFLMLAYCFETLNLARVQFLTRESNFRSRAAIQKLGAIQEGILRKDRISLNGITRNTVVFSVINDEWPAVKTMLSRQLQSSTV